jgi:hypothetical protein
VKNAFLLILVLIVLSLKINAQQQQYKVGLIGFYNLENLFDTINQPDVQDEEFTPTGANRYTGKLYLDKLSKLEEVLSEMGTDHSPDGISILGVAEIENKSVLEDLVNMSKLKNRHYQIVHYDSKDARGIDVGLLYNPKYFRVRNSESLLVPIYNDDSTGYRYTRDVLFVSGEYLGEPLHIFVNHWPSRRGGEEATAPLRELGAAVCKAKIDSLVKINPDTKFIVMGDLNDNPTDPSVAKVLNAKRKKEEVKTGGMYNPWIDLYKKGIGTLAYQDAWSLFDQIIISSGFLDQKQSGYFFKEPIIFKRDYMLQKTGRFKGYPFRTFNGSVYAGGYSDHFPTYIVLLKAVK